MRKILHSDEHQLVQLIQSEYPNGEVWYSVEVGGWVIMEQEDDGNGDLSDLVADLKLLVGSAGDAFTQVSHILRHSERPKQP